MGNFQIYYWVLGIGTPSIPEDIYKDLVTFYLDDTLQDKSNYARSLTNYGVSINSAEKHNNKNTLYFSGASKSYLSVPYHSDIIRWIDTDFTIEYWVKFLSFAVPYDPFVIGQVDTASLANYWSMGPMSTTNLSFYFYNGSGGNLIGNVAPSIANVWQHHAMSYDKNTRTMRLFANGKQIKTATNINTATYSTSNLIIGRYQYFMLNGYLQGLRITKACRYKSDFIPLY